MSETTSGSGMKPTPLWEIKGKRERIVGGRAGDTGVTHPSPSGRVYRIRGMSGMEMMKAGLPGVIPVELFNTEDNQKPSSKEAVFKAINFLSLVNWAMENCVLEPKIWTGDYATTPEDRAHISDIEVDEMFLWNAIFDASGFGEAAKRELSDFFATRSESSSSIRSLSDTASSPTN
jgi:hypothetical protein